MVIEQQKRQQDGTGKGREEKDDEGAAFTVFAQVTYSGISGSSSKRTDEADQRRDKIGKPGTAWLNDEQAPGKGGQHCTKLEGTDPFLQQKK